jgi:iron complex outermembrane receptor protein
MKNVRRSARRRLLPAQALLGASVITLAQPLLLAPANPAMAETAPAAAQRYAFDLPAGPLTDALSAWSQRTGITIDNDALAVAGRSSAPLRGSYTAEDALRLLLASNGIGYRFTTPTKVQLQAAGAAPTAAPDGGIVLPQLQVSGDGTQETADGPVTGYRATRSGTGTLTDTALRDVPQSIQVVPRQVLEDQQTTRLVDALSNVSNVRPATTTGNRSETFNIRGFRVSDYAIDGITTNPALEASEVYRDMANIERVEVLKGPASVLYGQGDLGGMINLVTRQPQFEPGVSGALQAGAFDFYRGEIDVTGPLDSAGTLAGRLIASAQTDGTFRDVMQDSTREFGALSLLWQPTEATRIRFGGTYTHQDLPFDRGLVAVGDGVTLPIDRYLGESWSEFTAEKTEVNLRVEHDAADWLTLRQTTHVDWGSAHRLSADPVALQANNVTLTRRATDQNDTTRATDLRLDAIAKFNTGSAEHTFLLGGEYTHGRRHLNLDQATLAAINIEDPHYGAEPGGFVPRTDRTKIVDGFALYAQEQIAFTEQIKVIGGLRADFFDMTDTTNNVEKRAEGTHLSPRIGLVYQPVKLLSLYASYATSFVPQAGASADGEEFSPETGQQYEVGMKLDLIPEKLAATLAVFQLTKQNVLTTDPNDSTAQVQTGEQRSRGVELDISGEILPGWQITANAAYLQAVITKDNTYAVGNGLVNAPHLSGSIWSVYQFQDGPWKGVGFGGGIQAAGRRQGDLGNSFQVDGYVRVDATIFYDVTDNLRLSVLGTNLFDSHYIETPVSRTENYPGEPLSVVGKISAHF